MEKLEWQHMGVRWLEELPAFFSEEEWDQGLWDSAQSAQGPKEKQPEPTTHVASISLVSNPVDHADDGLKLRYDLQQCCSAPVLAAPDFNKPFKVKVDVSATGDGAVLLQDGLDNISHLVSYFSVKFKRHQLNYSTIEKETLAMLLALQHFEVYAGSSIPAVVVCTDHNPLVFLNRM
eukprot:superscaffoldBa00000707_g6691